MIDGITIELNDWDIFQDDKVHEAVRILLQATIRYCMAHPDQVITKLEFEFLHSKESGAIMDCKAFYSQT